ncbi:sulfite reductase subunit alpha [Rothia mucilaginosa]|uniref:sulfite reductase subunit alpha n=1 Tax=Rothia mucilaginosa TaxID=43675 RepID=UPI0026F34091|nr:sulfite reductase subunit alpha [Rothia mucilaginosa]
MSEATGSKPYSEDEAYLYETYVTEDGIEVPPPTKVMGPRRLARYREEVAEYLRAARRGEPAKPVANMGSVIYTNAIDPQVLAVQRRFAALAAQGKIDTEANDEEKLHEPAPLTSSLRVLRPEEIAQNRVDATSPSAVNNPMTSSIPVIAVVKEEKPEPELHQYLVRDEPKVEELDSSDIEAEQTEVASVEEEAVEVEESADELPTRVSAVNAQGLDLSVLDSASAGDTVDSVDGDPTVALSPDEVEELLQRMVDRQGPDEALVEETAEESDKGSEDEESEPAESKSASVASAEASEEAESKEAASKETEPKKTGEDSASESAVEKAEEVLQPAQKPSLAWLWIVLLLALVVVGLIMIFGPK